MATLIAKPSDAQYWDLVTNKKHKLTIKAHCWDVPKIISVQYKRQALEYINLYLSTADQEMPKENYLRIHMYQDEPNFLTSSHPYIYAYSRPIDDTMPIHRKELDKCPSTCIAAEINLATFGYFVWIKKSGWQARHLTLNDITLVDVRDDEGSVETFNPYLEARYYTENLQGMRYLGCEGNALSDELAEAYYDMMRDIPNEKASKHLGMLIKKFVQMARFHSITIPEHSDGYDVEFRCEGCDLIVCIFMKEVI